MASFPVIDGIKENPISYPEFGPEPHISWPLEKSINLIIDSGLKIESILRKKSKLDNQALITTRDYWILCLKE